MQSDYDKASQTFYDNCKQEISDWWSETKYVSDFNLDITTMTYPRPGWNDLPDWSQNLHVTGPFTDNLFAMCRPTHWSRRGDEEFGIIIDIQNGTVCWNYVNKSVLKSIYETIKKFCIYDMGYADDPGSMVNGDRLFE